MLKKYDKVILNNRGKKEFGTISKSWRRKEIHYFNIKTERGIELEGITFDSSFPCYIVEDLSEKLNSEKLCQLG